MRLLFVKAGALDQFFGVLAGSTDLLRKFHELRTADRLPAERLQGEPKKSSVELGGVVHLCNRRQREKFPFDLLPSDAFAPSEEKGSHGAEAAPAEPLAALSHVARPAAVAFGRTVLGSEEGRRGELVHRMLELTVYADDDLGAQLERAAERAAREARRDPMDAKTLIPGLRRMLESPELGSCFTRAPGRTVFVEKELCGPDGALSRMDRVVCDPGRVTVIDFKTGAEEPAEHGEQMRTYLRLLSGVYPGRAVGAIVAYLDLGVARRIE